jgi:hypothetical protein
VGVTAFSWTSFESDDGRKHPILGLGFASGDVVLLSVAMQVIIRVGGVIQIGLGLGRCCNRMVPSY